MLLVNAAAIDNGVVGKCCCLITVLLVNAADAISSSAAAAAQVVLVDSKTLDLASLSKCEELNASLEHLELDYI